MIIKSGSGRCNQIFVFITIFSKENHVFYNYFCKRKPYQFSTNSIKIDRRTIISFLSFVWDVSILKSSWKCKSWNSMAQHLSCVMRKPMFCIWENKGTDQLRSNCAFVFTTWIVQFLLFLNLKFPASIRLLCLFSSVHVGPVLKPHCRFSHDAAHYLLSPLLVLHKSFRPIWAYHQFKRDLRKLCEHMKYSLKTAFQCVDSQGLYFNL